jgi:hypothetical protein
MLWAIVQEIDLYCRISGKYRQGEAVKAYLTGLLQVSRAVTTDITQRTAQPSAYKGLSFYVIAPLT